MNQPAEVFGHGLHDTSDDAQHHRQAHWCPFLDARCTKKSRNIDYPFGVCSVRYGQSTVAICPNRFCQDDQVLRDIAMRRFGSDQNVLSFAEVATRARARSGRSVRYSFDYVLVKHRPLHSQIEDFAVVEFQTVDTTSTGQLGKAFTAIMAGEDIADRTYGFGMNWANV
jgi:hypothetical protein